MYAAQTAMPLQEKRRRHRSVRFSPKRLRSQIKLMYLIGTPKATPLWFLAFHDCGRRNGSCFRTQTLRSE
jgi:hypothetical protein